MNLLLKKVDSVDAELAIPGSKSYSNRALIAAVLNSGTTTLNHVSQSDDTATMIAELKNLGANITQDGTTVTVEGWGNDRPTIEAEVNVGPAGTTARFLTALATTLPNSTVVIRGNAHMNTRPIGPLVEALRLLGAEIEYLESEGSTPLKISAPAALSSAEITMPGSTSSQFISALMLIAPAIENGLSISVSDKITSASYLEMTTQIISMYGANTSGDLAQKLDVYGSYSGNHNVDIEADATGAMNFLALAAAAGGSMQITNLSPQSRQGDVIFADLLAQMGCEYDSSAESVKITSAGELNGISCDMNLLPDSAMALGVVAGFATSESTINGLETLKHKETDRLHALKTELEKFGVSSATTEDSITIQPQGETPTETPSISTYDDHRIAMAFAVACANTDVLIENAEVVSKSFPNFWELLGSCGIQIEEAT